MCNRLTFILGILIIGLTVFNLTGTAQPQRNLTQSEIQSLLHHLTESPRSTWIDSGIIQARHISYTAPRITDPDDLTARIKAAQKAYLADENKPEQAESWQDAHYKAIPFNIRYKLANETKMVQREIVTYDNGKFLWQQQILSRHDSVQPPVDQNDMYEYFDLETNGHKIYRWDGNNYVLQFPQVNSVQIIENAMGSIPAVQGPMKAGLIRWGHLLFSYDKLIKLPITAIQNGSEIEMTIPFAPDHTRKLVFDKAKDYALINATTVLSRITIISQYSDYRKFNHTWVPGQIQIDQFNTASGKFILADSDTWIFEEYQPLPPDFSFTPQFAPDTLIHYLAAKGRQYSYYYDSDTIDSPRLLQEKLTLSALPRSVKHNCATTSIKYILSKFGVNTRYQDLTSLINHNNQTSLKDISNWLKRRRYWTQAVTADLNTLEKLRDQCQILLLFPENHFCVLGKTDEDFVRIVDMQRNHFYYRIDRQQFMRQWQNGTALLISSHPVTLSSDIPQLDDTQMSKIFGAQGHSCTKLLQSYRIILCPPAWMGNYSGSYRIYFERWGCEPSSSGFCFEDNYPRMSESKCICNSAAPDQCTISGEWTTNFRNNFLKACK